MVSSYSDYLQCGLETSVATFLDLLGLLYPAKTEDLMKDISSDII